jgi:catechol 2,3-dioxygenase-like lactoylglutathione lyase family enzyme
VIGRLHHVIIDCPDPAALAEFYAELLGLPLTYTSRRAGRTPTGRSSSTWT